MPGIAGCQMDGIGLPTSQCSTKSCIITIPPIRTGSVIQRIKLHALDVFVLIGSSFCNAIADRLAGHAEGASTVDTGLIPILYAIAASQTTAIIDGSIRVVVVTCWVGASINRTGITQTAPTVYSSLVTILDAVRTLVARTGII